MHNCAAITRGVGGSLCYDGAHLIQTMGVITNAVNTNGAGDIFAVAFLYAINFRHNFVWAAKFATAASARVVGNLARESKWSNRCISNGNLAYK